MKLFFHWLRWELRRFLPMLGFWTLLVLGYAIFLGLLHLNILTIKPEWMEWNQPMALGLGIVQVFLLLHLFSTDPAVGTDCFWKTRPPGGIAVAGAKLVIALGFFLALPMLAWLIMNKLCVPPAAVTNGWHDSSWTQFLWWNQALLIGSLSLASASVAHAWQIPLRVALGFVLAMVPAVLTLVVINPALYDVIPPENSVKNFIYSFPVGILLLGGTTTFLLARWNGAWKKVAGVAGMVLPAVLLTLLPIPPEKAEKPQTTPEFANPTAGAGIRIEGFVLRSGLPAYSYQKVWSENEDVNNASYDMHLQISGGTNLSEGIPVGAGWRTLRLTAPDGRVLEGQDTAMQSRTIHRLGSMNRTNLRVSSAIFERSAVAAFSSIPCRAEGILRVMLNREETTEWPLQQNSHLLTPIARYYLPDATWDLSWITLGEGALSATRILNHATGEQWPAALTRGRTATGFLMQMSQHLGWIEPYPELPDWRGFQEVKKLKERKQVKDLTLKMAWQRPNGYVDIPVVLEPFILPRQKADKRTLADLIRAVPWMEGATEEQTKQGLRAVLMLASNSMRTTDVEAALQQALQEKLNLLKPEHLPMLLETARSYLSHGDVRYQKSEESLLKRRIAALVQPSDIDSLQLNKPLFHLLKPELIEAGHNLPEMPRPKSPKEMSDQELEGWDRVALDSRLFTKMIEEALRRGLPWSLEAIMEIVQSDSNLMSADANFDFLSSVSDAPFGSSRAKGWLRLHGHKLIWDTNLRKWVIPLIRGPGP